MKHIFMLVSVVVTFILLAAGSFAQAATVPTIERGSFDESTIYRSEQETMIFVKAFGLTVDVDHIKIVGAKNGYILAEYWGGDTEVLPIGQIFNPLSYSQMRNGLVSEQIFDGSTSLGEARYITVVSESPTFRPFAFTRFTIYTAKVLSEQNGVLSVQSTNGIVYKISENQMYRAKSGMFAGLKWGIGYYFLAPANHYLRFFSVGIGQSLYDQMLVNQVIKSYDRGSMQQIATFRNKADSGLTCSQLFDRQF